VLFWEGGSRVSLANVHSDSDGEISSVHYMTSPDLVESVERLGIYPGNRPQHHGPPALM
jgi:RNA:NAD 2'-phosphotransferase (TPT1/KptA family)